MPDPRNTYLENEVFTATPQKLRLMVIDGALRFANRALDVWDQDTVRNDALTRCRALVSELLSSIKVDETKVAQNVARLYAFVYELLVDAHIDKDKSKVSETIEILQIERETWRQVCEAMPHAPAIQRREDAPQGLTARSLPAFPGSGRLHSCPHALPRIDGISVRA